MAMKRSPWSEMFMRRLARRMMCSSAAWRSRGNTSCSRLPLQLDDARDDEVGAEPRMLRPPLAVGADRLLGRLRALRLVTVHDERDAASVLDGHPPGARHQ